MLGLAGPNSGALVERLTEEQDWPFLQARQVGYIPEGWTICYTGQIGEQCKPDRWVDHKHVQKAVSFQFLGGLLTIGFELNEMANCTVYSQTYLHYTILYYSHCDI